MMPTPPASAPSTSTKVEDKGLSSEEKEYNEISALYAKYIAKGHTEPTTQAQLERIGGMYQDFVTDHPESIHVEQATKRVKYIEMLLKGRRK